MNTESPVPAPAMNQDRILRPLERRVLRLVDEGVDDNEIGRRFRRSPGTIRRIVAMARLPRALGPQPLRAAGLRPLERRVLRWREGGIGYTEIGPRFRRSPAFIERVEVLARYKLDRPGRADPSPGS
jgi:DNA-binding CsgD family transcriptional regulator